MATCRFCRTDIEPVYLPYAGGPVYVAKKRAAGMITDTACPMRQVQGTTYKSHAPKV